jgi:hypothetical protein
MNFEDKYEKGVFVPSQRSNNKNSHSQSLVSGGDAQISLFMLVYQKEGGSNLQQWK